MSTRFDCPIKPMKLTAEAEARIAAERDALQKALYILNSGTGDDSDRRNSLAVVIEWVMHKADDFIDDDILNSIQKTVRRLKQQQ